MSIVNSIGAALLAIFALFIRAKKQKKRTDYLLLLIVLLYITYLLANVWTQHYLSTLSFLLQNLSAAFLFFPFLLYALLLIEQDHRFKRWWWIFALFDLAFTAFLLVDILLFDRLSSYTIEQLYTAPPLSYIVFYKAHGFYKIGVLIWYLKRLHQYRQQLKNYYSNIDGISLNWLRFFVWIYIGENAVSSLAFIPFDLGYFEHIETPFLITNIVLVASLFYLIFKGIQQYTLANFAEAQTEKAKEVAQPVAKYLTSSLSKSEMEGLYESIQTLFEAELIFQNPELKVQHLAQRLGVSNHNVSQTINQLAQQTFYEYVNSFRVAHFKELLVDPTKSQFTILALGLESGFNSKASLNRVFKQQTGITPREFQRQAKGSTPD